VQKEDELLTHIDFEEKLVPLDELGRLLRILRYESFNYKLIEVRCSSYLFAPHSSHRVLASGELLVFLLGHPGTRAKKI
jgi:hypothetical protein